MKNLIVFGIMLIGFVGLTSGVLTHEIIFMIIGGVLVLGAISTNIIIKTIKNLKNV